MKKGVPKHITTTTTTTTTHPPTTYTHISHTTRTYISMYYATNKHLPGLDSREGERERNHTRPPTAADVYVCAVFGHVLIAINIYVISHQLRGGERSAMETGNGQHLHVHPPPFQALSS